MSTHLSVVVGRRLKRGERLRLTRSGMAIVCVVLLALQSCRAERSSSPTQPSPVSENDSAAREAIGCVPPRERSFRVHPEYEDFCTEDSIRRGFTTTCRLEYNARLSHSCSDGWPSPAVSNGVVRVRIALSAFRNSQRFHTRRWSYDIGPGEATWLCGEDGGVAPEPCKIDITGVDLQRHATGPFQLRTRWNACWLQDGVSGEEPACNPDPREPEFPSSPYGDGGFISGL